MIKKINQFIQEYIKWKKSGHPIRTQERVNELFIICSSNECKNYNKKDEDSGGCNICGCTLNKEMTGLNKLLWSTTKCPYDPPFWTEEEEYKGVVVTEQEIQQEQPPRPEPRQGGCGCGK